MASIALKYDEIDKWTDSQIDDIEKEITALYRRAWLQMSKQEKEFFNKLEIETKVKKQEVEDKKITENDYKLWLLNKINSSAEWKSIKKKMLDKIVETQKQATDYVNEKTEDVFVQNYNYESYQQEQATGINTQAINSVGEAIAILYVIGSISSKDEKKSTKTASDLFKKVGVNAKKTYFYNDNRINKIVDSGIMQGQSIPKIANSIYKVFGGSKSSAIRTARTSVTSAQNSGRLASREALVEDSEKYGFHLRHQWIATHDARTRDSHAMLDGEIVEIGEPFSNGLIEPGDKNGAPSEVYNCRCTTKTVIDGITDKDYTNRKDFKEYHEWFKEKQQEKEIRRVSNQLRKKAKEVEPNITKDIKNMRLHQKVWV